MTEFKVDQVIIHRTKDIKLKILEVQEHYYRVIVLRHEGSSLPPGEINIIGKAGCRDKFVGVRKTIFTEKVT